MTSAENQQTDKTAREGDSLYAENDRKPAKAHDYNAFAKIACLDPVSVSTRKRGELSDSDVLRASESVLRGNSARSIAKQLGVSHTALNKRLAKLDESDGYHPDATDKAIIQAVLDAGIRGGMNRLAGITGWSVVELLEAVGPRKARHGWPPSNRETGCLCGSP
jgi:hypothetical protein